MRGRPKNFDNRVKFTTTIDSELLQKIKIKAVEEGKNVNDLLEKFISEYIK